MSRSDQQLVDLVLSQGDRDAYGELVQRHQSAVRRFLFQLTRGNWAWADDLAQDSFVRAYEQLDRFRGDSSFLTWVFGIAHNQFRNGRRKERPQVGVEEIDRELGGTAPATRASDLRDDLSAALLRLPEEERTALHLCYQQDLPHAEAAALLGWPLGTLKTHLARGKEQLKLLLTPWNPAT